MKEIVPDSSETAMKTINAEIFRTLVEHSNEGSLILTAKGVACYVSPAVENMLGYRPDELTGTAMPELSHPGDLALLSQTLSEVIQKPNILVKSPVFRIRHKDGSYRWIESAVTNMLDNPAINGIIANFRDVTQDRIAEENLIYANRLYDFLSHINQTIVHVTDEKLLFEEACRIAINHGRFKYAWIGIPDLATGKIYMVASAGTTRRDRDFFSDYSFDSNGPISHVLAGMDYFVVDDIQSRNNSKFITYANERGFHSAIVLPIKKSGQVFALLSLYAEEKNFFNSKEVALLAEASGDLSFALDVFERDRKRTQAEIALKQKELRLTQAQEIANVGNWDLDFVTGISNWSDQALRIYGVDLEQRAQSYEKWVSFIHPDDKLRVLKTIKKAEKDWSNCAFYHRIIRNDGSIRYVHSQSHFEFNEKGIPKGLTGVVHDVTDIRNHEEALKASEDAFRESEFRYKQIVENAHEGIWLLNNENKTVFVNEKMCRILGYGCGEMDGADFASFIPHGETAANRVTATAHDTVVRFVTKSGKLIWANVAFSPIMENGRLALVSDITEKKELEELLDSATTMARIGGYEMDIANNTMFWSAMTRDIHEVPDSFVPGLESSMAFYKEGYSRDAIIEAGWAALKQGIPWDLELQIITAKGDERWVRVIGEPEHHNGRCMRIYGSFQDIDSRKRAELEVLHIAEEKNLILESISNAFFAVDTQWNVTYWNKEAEHLLSRERSNAIGMNLWEIYPELIGTDFFNYYHKAVKENAVQQFDALYEPIQMWMEVSAYPSPSGLSVYFKDITGRKTAEAERGVLMSEIIRRNQNLEQFSYIVSHNLRGPVANIMGIARELDNDANSKENEKLLKDGLAISVKRLDEVIIDLNHILQLRKDVTEKKETINLSWLVNGIQESIIDVVRAENVTIVTDFSAVDELFTLKSYLYSIFYNLILNSIKYKQPHLEPIIEIKTTRHDDRVTIAFRDNGLGIDLQKKREQIFGLYKRFHNHVEGKGVGLFMVKTQVEMLGGTIEIASEVNQGTTFTLEMYD